MSDERSRVRTLEELNVAHDDLAAEVERVRRRLWQLVTTILGAAATAAAGWFLSWAFGG